MVRSMGGNNASNTRHVADFIKSKLARQSKFRYVVPLFCLISLKKNITFVGLDVHKATIGVALADAGGHGDVHFYGTIGGDLEALHKVIRKLQSNGTELRFAYEAGPCGYDIYRSLPTDSAEEVLFYWSICETAVRW